MERQSHSLYYCISVVLISRPVLLLADLVDRMLMCLICFIGEGTDCDITTAPYHTNARLFTLVLSRFLTLILFTVCASSVL